MDASAFDETEFFRAIQDSGARALLIGRRALVILGLPVLTADYDFWISGNDITRFNAALEPFDLHATRTPEAAGLHGRYALENDEHIDVLVARSISAVDGAQVEFAALWERRQTIQLGNGVTVQLPSISDLIQTKRIASRPKDLEDIRLLEVLRQEGRP